MEVIVLRMEQYRLPQMAVAKCRILSTYTNMVYETVDNLCCITAQFFTLTSKEGNPQGNNLTWCTCHWIEILVKWWYSFQMMMDLCGLKYQKQMEGETY